MMKMKAIELPQMISLPSAAQIYFAALAFQARTQDFLIIVNTEEEAQLAREQASFLLSPRQILWLPAYDSFAVNSEDSYLAASRMKTLAALSAENRPHYFVISSLNSLLQKLAAAHAFKKQINTINLGQELAPEDLATILIKLHFQYNANPTIPGEFAIRGEILDIILPDYVGYRLNFAWGKVSSIKLLDLDSNLSTEPVSELGLYPIKEELEKDHSIIDYLNKPVLILNTLYKSYLKDCWLTIISDNQELGAENATIYDKFWESSALENLITANNPCFYDFSNEGAIKLLFSHKPNIKEPNAVATALKEILGAHKKQKIIIGCNNAKAHLQHLLTAAGLRFKEIEHHSQAVYNLLNLATLPLSGSFHAAHDVFIRQSDLTGAQENSAYQKVTNNKRKLKNILAELDTFKQGELVVHTDYGIGKFLGVEILQIGEQGHDCLKLEYANGDKLYVPIENIDAIKKYGSEDAQLDRLGNAGWQKRKAQLKDRLNVIAHQLIQTAAERKTAANQTIVLDTLNYETFCSQFPHLETEDQATASEAIKKDLTSDKLTERLICGDVGFGKTELAMRAAFIATAGNTNKRLQVAVIVPTTILCRQHYLNFVRRFEGFNVKIAELSRLVSSANQKMIKQDLASHEIDIIIGTHALLAKGINFANLGLLIIDEEQHFGVAQKEYLKQLRNDLHVISLSATPIPRSLHMSLVGIKELSIIATPPLNRLAIQTKVLEYNASAIKNILLQEKNRNGRSFYVVPRIQLLDAAHENLKQLVPQLTIRVVHGRIPIKALDEVMQDFYEGKFDILLCTPIIESGIDIPEANTIIIDHAQMLGLSQLYQLRGRVGRSKIKGHAYLILNGEKKFTKQAYSRLELMQHVDQLGAGFTIATHDMDARGFGNLVGQEQSGHIKEVGLELYQDMLEEALLMNRGQVADVSHVNPAINLGLPVYIPHEYVSEHNTRLSLYRQIGELRTTEEIEQFKNMLNDRYGSYPVEVEYLLEIVKIKQLCRQLQITNLDSGPQGFAIKFIEDPFGTHIMLLAMRENFARNGKISANNKFIVKVELTNNIVLKETNKVLNKLLELKHKLQKLQTDYS